jgi:hypothetical protein
VCSYADTDAFSVTYTHNIANSYSIGNTYANNITNTHNITYTNAIANFYLPARRVRLDTPSKRNRYSQQLLRYPFQLPG